MRTMIARVSIDGIIIYANEALAAYLKTPKRHLTGSSLEEVSRLCQRRDFAVLRTSPLRSHQQSAGQLTEREECSRPKCIPAAEHSTSFWMRLEPLANATSELRESSGTPWELLSEEELRTVRHPERRYLSITYTRLRGLPQLALRLDPMEMKLIIDSFVEEASESVRNAGGTVGETARDTVLGICGAPRYYSDHPLRAVLAACEQIQRASQLHAGTLSRR